MAPRPFPFPLSIGTDIVHVKRIYDILLRAQGKPAHRDRFLRRFLTPGEVREFQIRFSDRSEADEAHRRLISKHLAGRWAAKEAAIKAVTWRKLSFHDVILQRIHKTGALQAIIVDDASTAPQVEASGVETLCGSACDFDAISLHQRSVAQHTQNCGNDSSASIDGQIAKISISHDGEYATSVCLAASTPVEPERNRPWSSVQMSYG